MQISDFDWLVFRCHFFVVSNGEDVLLVEKLWWFQVFYRYVQYRSADSTGHEGTCPPPTFTNGWARGHREYRRTANKKL